MPTSVRVGARTTFTPGVYITLDDSALIQPSLGASGVVAILGTAVGGAPYTSIKSRQDIVAYSQPAALLRAYPAGDLATAANLAFSGGPTGGAQAVVPIKVNPASQASLRLNGSAGASVIFTAQAWGAGGNSVSVQVLPGTNQGVGLAIASGTTVESADNLAGAAVGTLSYLTAPGSYTQVTGGFQNGQLAANGTASFSGLAGEMGQATQLATPARITIVASASDAGASLTLYGVAQDGSAVIEQVALVAGTSQSQKTYKALLGARLSQPAFQVVLEDGSGATLASLTGNAKTAGLARCFGAFASGLPVAIQAPTGSQVLVHGIDGSGNSLQEVKTGTGQPVSTSASFARVDGLALGAVPASGQVVLAGRVLQVAAVGTSLAQLASKVSALIDTRGPSPAGLSLQAAPGEGATPMTSLDGFSGVDLTQAGGAVLTSDLEALIDWVNANSQLVTAAAPAGAVGLPSTSPSPLFLSGGAENAPTQADWQAALDLLKQVRVNLVACMTCAPAVTLAATAHCNYMSGLGESERFCIAGVQNAALTAPATTAQMYAQQAAVNAAYTQLVPNTVLVNDNQGNAQVLQPQFAAAALCGLRGGLPVGEPMTRKALNVLGCGQDSSWNALDNSDDLISHGICFLQQRDNVGVVVARDVTTWTRDGDVRKSSGSIAYSTGYAAYNFRLALQAYIGRSGFSGGLNQIITGATQLLSELKTGQIIFDFNPPTGQLTGDTVVLDVTIFAVPEINFILPTLHIDLPSLTVANAA